MTLLDARALTVVRNGTPILKDADFNLGAGEMVGLIGPNGAGKTTLLKCLIDLVRPDRGSVLLEDRPVSAISRAEISKRIAYLAQDAGVHWPMSVERVVNLGRLPHSSNFRGMSAADLAVVDSILKQTDIAHLRTRKATTLSGGERIRMLLAAALAVEAPILFADEPISGLDPGHQIQIMQLLRSIAAEDRSVVVVLHDLTSALRYCDRIVLMSEGEIVADEPAEDVLTEQRLAAVYGIEAHIQGEGESKVVVPTGLAKPGSGSSGVSPDKRSA